MDKKWMARQLPEEAPEGLKEWIWDTFPEELGGSWLVFHGERVTVPPTLSDVMEYSSLKPKTEWAAECTCTACDETFYTQKVPGADAIRFAVGEDGTPYPLDPGESYSAYAAIEEAFSGEELICPICLSRVTAIHSRNLRGGRRKRMMIQTLQNIEGYTTVFYWMAVRYLDEFGVDLLQLEPMDAYVLTETGSLVRYSHVERSTFGSYHQIGRWKQMAKCEDMHDSPYQDWGSINSKKVGAAFYEVYPDLEGTTGEKTGLTEYIRGGGFGLIQYLKFWRQHRNIENLVKAGQAELIVSIMRTASRYSYSIKMEMDKYIDLTEAKPHKMLGLSKEEFRYLREKKICLVAQDLEQFKQYRNTGGKMGLPAFMAHRRLFGHAGLRGAMDVMRETPADLDKIAKYMTKQGLRPDEVQLLVDTRRFAKRVNGDASLTSEDLWPRNLMAAHERLNQILEERRRQQDAEKKAAFDRKFLEVIQRYGCLQWTDGDLCILLPKCSLELHEEGRILRHCVGGYSDRHISGNDTIFFVRHYRRPERSYYTLDIRMNAGEPQEVQLHGYGNERHGKNKQYSHQIPKKVRSFVDRWKEEVLLPWWASENAENKEEKTA